MTYAHTAAILHNPKPEKEWFSRKEAAIYLTKLGCRITARTLEKRAANKNAGRGPSFTRIGWRMVQYTRSDLDAWAAKEMVKVE